MQTRTKVIITTLAVGIAAFMLGPNAPAGGFWDAAWPFDNSPEEAEPTGAQLPLLMVMAFVSALSLGMAVSLLAYGWPKVRAVAGSGSNAGLIMAALAWVLGNWWIHDNLHMVNGLDLAGLIVLEYVFHLTIIIATAFLAVQTVRVLTGTTPVKTPSTKRPAQATSG